MADYNNPADTVTVGTAGDDTFTVSDRGSSPTRAIDGAGGYDRLIVNRSFDVRTSIVINSFSSDQGLMGTVNPAGPYDDGFLYFQNFESVKFTGTAGDDGASITLDQLATSAVIDLDGGAGTDNLALDLSGRTADLQFVADTPTIASNFGKFTSFEQFVIYGGVGDDEIRTGDGDDELRGGDGSNVLSAGNGDDRIYTVSTTDFTDGGAGRDDWTGNYSTIAGTLTVVLGDTIKVGGKTVATNIESVTLGTGSGDDVIELATDKQAVIYGGSGSDLLRFRPATSQTETILINTTTDGSLLGGINSTAFSEMERIDFSGDGGDDSFRLIGNFTPAQIKLDGGSGKDLLTVQFDLLTGATTFLANVDGTVNSNRGQFSGFEQYSILGGAANDTIRTGAGNDFLDGGGGNDTLYGEGGDDIFLSYQGDSTIDGGTGDDTYYVDSASDVIVEKADEGIDSVNSRAGSYTLAANVENLYFSSEALSGDGTGNLLDNIIIGNMRDNVLKGLGGDDLIVGDLPFFPGDGRDTIEGGAGNDRLVSSRLSTATAGNIPAPDFGTEKDIVSGGAGDDEVWVGTNDEVDGGSGTDKLNLALSGLDAGVALTVGDLLSAVPFVNGTGKIANFEVLASLYATQFNDIIDLTGQSSAAQIDAGSGDDRVIGGAGNDRLFGSYGNDVIKGAGGNDNIQGGFGSDIAEYGGKLADYRIVGGGSRFTITDLRPGSPDGSDVLADVETLRFADGDRIPQDVGASTLWRSFAGDGFVGEVGGRGLVFSTSAHQDISILDVPGLVSFDASFNKGGDVIRVPGNAQTWIVATSGSNAVLVHGDTVASIPYGPVGTAIVFADGVRALRYDSATQSVKIGSQTLSQSFVPLTAASEGSPPAGETVPDASNRIFVAFNGEIFAGGKASVFGTSGREDVHLSSGNVVLDPSFNRGGDTIWLAQEASAFVARESGSNVILHSEMFDVTVPFGPAGTTIRFVDGDRTLRYDLESDALLLGGQIIGTEPIILAEGVV